MKKYLASRYPRIIFYAFLTWLVPLLASIPFYSRNGGLNIDILFFKSIMIVVGSTIAALLLVLHFKRIDSGYLKEGVIVGLIWLLLNWLLDLLFLVPIAKLTIAEYSAQIGLRYLVIPVMSLMLGTSLANRKAGKI